METFFNSLWWTLEMEEGLYWSAKRIWHYCCTWTSSIPFSEQCTHVEPCILVFWISQRVSASKRSRQCLLGWYLVHLSPKVMSTATYHQLLMTYWHYILGFKSSHVEVRSFSVAPFFFQFWEHIVNVRRLIRRVALLEVKKNYQLVSTFSRWIFAQISWWLYHKTI